MLRLLLIVLFLILFFFFSLIMYVVLFFVGKVNKERKDIIALRLIQWAFKVILFVSGTKMRIIGYDNIPKDEPVLFVANHRSIFDIIVTYSMMPGRTGYVSKIEMEKVPLVSWWMRYLYCLFLDRDNIKEGLKTILQGIEYIKSGISIFIFPEGTRNKAGDDEIREFKEGSFKMAVKTGCKVIPVAINNTETIFEKHFPFIRRAKVVVEFGTPVDLSVLGNEQKKFLGAYTRDIIKDMYMKNKELV